MDEVLRGFIYSHLNEIKSLATIIDDGGGDQDDIISAVKDIIANCDSIIEEMEK